MTEQSLEQLYSTQILALATDIPHAGRLAAPAASVKKRSPLCGSTVTVDLVARDGRVAEFAQNVKACALGQASASVLGRVVIGLDRATIAAGRAALFAMLTQDGPTPPAPFEGLEVLRPAQAYKNRHPSILLAWDATLAALDEASASAGAS
ncbi:iron-sulfur cluster assembly scaffold protein [Sinisalibacter aestuarii]|uniref:Iron-sulfur cluster scaffold-like protein n=1 Tax=Sinisalibacter aestuarii TaxID=2949426 RepID=A0ABQ5LRJ6_9RHOB|nr:iron-sulfur cluster assembly scaffold protein [Sinisalibacter aestuarii]GKY87627.1 iron-sulfur cluster scaffold-like protein [Sinisalibacter aestuarii]